MKNEQNAVGKMTRRCQALPNLHAVFLSCVTFGVHWGEIIRTCQFSFIFLETEQAIPTLQMHILSFLLVKYQCLGGWLGGGMPVAIWHFY